MTGVTTGIPSIKIVLIFLVFRTFLKGFLALVSLGLFIRHLFRYKENQNIYTGCPKKKGICSFILSAIQ